MKKCSKCGIEKKTEEFSNNKSKSDGLQSYCRVCAKTYNNVYRFTHEQSSKGASAAWQAQNPEKAKLNRARFYASHPGYRAAWYAANLKRKKAADAAWSSANKDAKRIHKQNRIARKRCFGGILSKGLSEKLYKLQRGKCACCGKPLGNHYHLDHIMPLALGGSNTDDNIQLLRQKCNKQKHVKHPVDFMRSRGYLI